MTHQGCLFFFFCSVFLLSISGYFYPHCFIVSVCNTRGSTDNGGDHPSSSPSPPPGHLHILKSLQQNKRPCFLCRDKSNQKERLLTTCPPPHQDTATTTLRPHVSIQASPDRERGPNRDGVAESLSLCLTLSASLARW